jgi:spermidine synthase
MKPWAKLGAARAPDGTELTLWRRDDEFVLRAGGADLMMSRMHASEEALATVPCAELPADGRVLVGGMGMGYTARAVLDLMSPRGRLTVSELIPEVVEWNRGPLGPLAGHPLDDPRLTVDARDVAVVLRDPASAGRFDAILLDVDNGPAELTQKRNVWLYSPAGLAAARKALRPGGALAVWSAGEAPGFDRELTRAGFAAKIHRVRARGPRGGARHVVFVGRI